MVKKRLPENILIGPRYYKVSQVKNLKSKCGRPVMGKIIPFDKTIELDAALRGYEPVETLVHEIMHGITWQMDIPMGEKTVDRLSYALTQMLLDNPDLLALLTTAAAERTARKARSRKRKSDL
jgi:hypothetical protein